MQKFSDDGCCSCHRAGSRKNERPVVKKASIGSQECLLSRKWRTGEVSVQQTQFFLWRTFGEDCRSGSIWCVGSVR